MHVSVDPLDAEGADANVSLATFAPFATVSLLLRAFRRRERLLVGMAVAGVAAGVLLSSIFPPEYSSTTTLLLQPATVGDPAQSMATESQLLKSRAVAGTAIERLNLPLTPERLRLDSNVTVLSPTILKLTVTGPSATEAVRRAAGLADAFLLFRRQEFERQSKVEVEALGQRAADVNAQLAKVNQAINAFASRSDAKTDSGLRDYGDLLSQKATLGTQLGQLQQRIDTVTVAPASSVAKGRVLDPASMDTRSPPRAMAINGLSGLVAGLALCAGWVSLRELVSDKVRRSDEVALAFRTPVAITARRLGGSARRQRALFRRNVSKASPDVVRVMRVWRGLWSGPRTTGRELVVLAVGGDTEAAHFVACAAAELAREGRNVVVADLSDKFLLAGLFAVAAEGQVTVRVPKSASTLQLIFPSNGDADVSGNGADPPPHPSVPGADFVISLVTPKGLGEAAEPSLSGTTVAVVVGAGEANAALLRSIGRILSEREMKVDHVVVVGADATDTGVGLPGTAWAGIASPTAQPLRMPLGSQT